MRYANAETEAIILSAILNGRSEFIDQLTNEDITISSYKTILKTARELHGDGKSVDIVSVGMKLKGQGNLLSEISSQYLMGVNYESCIESLKSYTAKRKVYHGLQYIQDQLTLENPAEIKANILDYFSDIPLPGQKQDDSAKTVLLKTYQYLEQKYQNRNDTSNHTGIPDLDQFTGGLHPSEVTILAARPSIGKTALGVQIALQVAQKGKTVQIFSREMSQVQLGTRLIANQGEIDGQRMRTGHIRDKDWRDISRTTNTLSKLPIHINDEASTMPAIRAVCAEKKHKGLDLIVIDYMQLIEPVKRSDKREGEVAEISRSIKKMSLEFEIPIIALSQLNRSAANKRPTLDTLRESGAIEQDADNVILLHKPDEIDVDPNKRAVYRELKRRGKDWVEVILAKQRNGPTGFFNMLYNPKYLKFESISRRDEL